LSIRRLFGQHCSGTTFDFDERLAALRERFQPEPQAESQKSEHISSSPVQRTSEPNSQETASQPADEPGQSKTVGQDKGLGHRDEVEHIETETVKSRKRTHDQYSHENSDEKVPIVPVSELVSDSQLSAVSSQALELRVAAYQSMASNLDEEGDWASISLISTTDHHTVPDKDLGCT
jgi:hypothetical protein